MMFYVHQPLYPRRFTKNLSSPSLACCTLTAMNNDDHASLYAHVPALYWPWLWLQLFWLNCWMARTGRGALVAVSRTGEVFVQYIQDDPDAPKAWHPAPSTPPAWARLSVPPTPVLVFDVICLLRPPARPLASVTASLPAIIDTS